jgi:asterless protein
LEREFGNISEEEIDDVNDTVESTRYDCVNQNNDSSNNQHNDFPLRDDFVNLKNLVEMKQREIEHVTGVLSLERKQHKQVVDEFEKRIAIAEAEKERALMNRNQTHELLVENKSKLIECNDEYQGLKGKVKSLELENEKLVGELESTKLMLSDVQAKYGMVEKNVLFNAERNTDKILKQAQERNNAQVAMMQQQIDNLKSKYDELEHDYKHLDIRYKELQRSRESMLIEKGEVINQLNCNLEEAQRKYQEVLMRPDLSMENRRLQSAIQTVEYQKEEMSMTINKLQRKLQEQNSEMEMMDSIIHEIDGNNQSYTEMSKFINRDPLKNVNSTPMSPELRLSKVKEELCKALNNIKTKREEIKILERQLLEKDKEITEVKRDENKTLIELEKCRDEIVRLENKQSILQKELDDALCKLNQYESAGSNHLMANEELKKQLDTKQSECDDLLLKIEKLKLKENEASELFNRKQEKLQATIDELTAEMNDKNEEMIKTLQICQKCEELLQKISKVKSIYIKYLQ